MTEKTKTRVCKGGMLLLMLLYLLLQHLWLKGDFWEVVFPGLLSLAFLLLDYPMLHLLAGLCALWNAMRLPIGKYLRVLLDSVTTCGWNGSHTWSLTTEELILTVFSWLLCGAMIANLVWRNRQKRKKQAAEAATERDGVIL